MAVVSIFDVLVQNLSISERRDLLERIRRAAPVSLEPLFALEATAGPPRPAYEERIAQLGLLARLILFLRRLFSGKSSEEILSTDDLRAIAKRIELYYPGLVDHRRALLLEVLHEQLRQLRDAARFFAEVLARSVDKDKPAFIAFLASIRLPELHGRLLSETDPFLYAENHPGLGEAEIRTAVLASFDEALGTLDEERRRSMYLDLRSLLFLRRLSGFLFERLLGNFKAGQSASGGPAASFPEARDLLLELGDVIFSLATPPSVELAEALFVFAAGEELGKPGYDAETTLAAQLAATESALAKIRAFNLRIPLTDLLCLVSDNPNHHPRELPGGEDWFVLYRSFWKERIEARLETYRQERRYLETQAEILAFLGRVEPTPLPHLSHEGTPDSPPIRLELAFIFLDGFYRGLFLREINRPLKIILVDGEFYRKDNRIEFTDAYNEMLRLPETIRGFDARLSPEGDIGQSYAQAKTELVSLPVKRRKLQSIERGAEDEAERIVRRAADAMILLAKIIRGVLKGEAGGRYDSLQNLSYLDGKANREFLRSLEQTRANFGRAVLLLKEITGLDLGNVD